MPTLKLTQVAVERLKPPAEGRAEYWDSQLPGFGLRINAPRAVGRGPRKTWQVMYRVDGKKVRETLGTLATIARVEDARDLARASLHKAQQGIHPVKERQRVEEQDRCRIEAELARERDTLGAAIDCYLERYAIKRMRPDYFKETKRTLNRDVKPALGARPIRDINRRDIRELLEEVVDRGSPSHANHVLAYLRAMLNWAVSNDLIPANPTNGLKMPAPLIERERVLSDAETRLFWLACNEIGWPFGPLFQLLLLTAQRRDELAQAPWPEFDLIDRDNALWTLPSARAKNKKAHLIHLSPLAVDIIRELPQIGSDDGFVFTTNGTTPVSGFGRARERLATAMLELRKLELGDASDVQIEPFTLQDLRRTATTGMARIGIAHHVADKILNHVTGKISGVARIYNRAEYLEERKAALNAWSRYVEGLINPAPTANVIPIASAR